MIQTNEQTRFDTHQPIHSNCRAAAYLNHEMHGRTGGSFSRLLASRSPVPRDFYRYLR